MRLTELKRLYKIVRVHLEYGLDFPIPAAQTEIVPFWFRQLYACRHLLFWINRKRYQHQSVGERLRLALQELGPVWIKFGQMMSTRRDLFPHAVADQLALLQDKVAPFDGLLAKAEIERALAEPIELQFSDFELQPLASASVAQVHCAKLKSSGKEVVFKVIRPDIRPIIDIDIVLMYRLAHFVERAYPKARRLKLVAVVGEYEKTLLNELDLRLEAANATKLRNNFADSEELYVPEVFADFSRKTVMVSERIYGIPVSDIDKLQANNTNMKLLAERGVSVFFTQVFRDSFFHADMHPGNVFVNPSHPQNPQWIGLDCGIVGTLNRDDQRYLAGNFLAFFNRDYRQVAQLHVKSGWVPADTNIDEFELAIRLVCEPIFAKPLCEISFGQVLLNLFNTARCFQMEVQPQLVLLQKTLLYVEGLGRELYPQLDLWVTAKPFLEKWMTTQVGLQALLRSFKENTPDLMVGDWLEQLPKLPNLFIDGLSQGKLIDRRLAQFYQGYQQHKRQQSKGQFLFGVGATLLICASILLTNAIDGEGGLFSYQMIAYIAGVSGVLFWIVSWREFNRYR